MKIKTKYRKRSKFDPYIDYIIEFASMGLTTSEIANRVDAIGEFDDCVDESAIYAFLISRGIRERSRKIVGDMPKCEWCQARTLICDLQGNEKRCCNRMTIPRMVSDAVTTSPVWCPERKKSQQDSGYINYKN